jgi:hypothetical protein
MINYFLGAALVAVPFFIKSAPQTTPILSQEYFFGLVAMLGALLFGIGKTSLRVKIFAVSLFLVSFVSDNPFGIFQYFHLAMSAAGALLIALVYSKRHEIDLGFIGKCLGAVCVLESAWILLNAAKLDLYIEWLSLIGIAESTRSYIPISGSLGNINHSAALVSCTVPFLSPYLWIFPISALLVGKSAMPLICFAASVLALFSYKTKNYFHIISFASVLSGAAMALVLGLIPPGSYFSDSGRLIAWKDLLGDLGFQIIGNGLGYVPDVFSRKLIFGQRFYQAHNEWLELYSIAGVVGLAIGAYLILPIFKNKGNPAINACLISLFVNSLGNFTFHIAPLFMVFATCYALQLDKE